MFFLLPPAGKDNFLKKVVFAIFQITLSAIACFALRLLHFLCLAFCEIFEETYLCAIHGFWIPVLGRE